MAKETVFLCSIQHIRSMMVKETDKHSDLELAVLLWRSASGNYVHTEDNVKIQILSLAFKLAAWKVAYNIYSYSSKSNLFQYFTIELVKKILKFSYYIITHVDESEIFPKKLEENSPLEIIDSNYIFAKRPRDAGSMTYTLTWLKVFAT